jgi:hypothetical protein
MVSNMAAIFISYRRDDSANSAHRLAESLRGRFDVFMDVSNIDPGMTIPDEIQRELTSCLVVLVVIGRRWVSAVDEQQRVRLTRADDWVRREITTALNLGKTVIPVLVENAPMPSSDQLPSALRRFSQLNAFEIRSDRWDSDTEILVSTIGGVLDPGPIPLHGPARPPNLLLEGIIAPVLAIGLAQIAIQDFLPVPLLAATGLIGFGSGILNGCRFEASFRKDALLALVIATAAVILMSAEISLPLGEWPRPKDWNEAGIWGTFFVDIFSTYVVGRLFWRVVAPTKLGGAIRRMVLWSARDISRRK